jgi:hypothetical protein
MLFKKFGFFPALTVRMQPNPAELVLIAILGSDLISGIDFAPHNLTALAVHPSFVFAP